MKNKIIFVILILMMCTSTVFASDWDLSYEKETYKDIANLYNMPVDENGTLYGSKGAFSTKYTLPDFFTNSFITNFFGDIEFRLENSSYSQNDYKNFVIKFENPTISVVIAKDLYGFSGDNIQLNNFVIFNYNYSNNNFSFKNVAEYLTGNYSNFNGFCYYTGGSSYTKLRTFLLSSLESSEKNYTYNSNYAPYGDRTNFAEVIIQENQVKIDPTKTYDNNILLNIDIINGKFINYEYQIYYLENEEKVYITDNINYLNSDLKYGNLRGFYISPDYVSQLPNNTQFYIDVVFHINKNYTTSILSDNTLPAFKTGAISSGGTGEGEGGGNVEDTPGGDTGGSTIDLGNIENTLGDINTSIIEVGQQTNQNLDEIEQVIKDVNESITAEPVYDEDGNLAEEQPGMIGKLLQGFWNVLVKFFDWLMVPDEEQISDIVDDVLENDLISESVLGLPLQLISRFLNIFENLTYTDWVIAWDDINFTFSEKDGSKIDMKMFDAYTFNISEFVRNDETLSEIYSYYLILVNFGAVCGLIYWGAGLVKGLLGIEDSMPGANDETDSPDVTSTPDNPARRTSEKPVEKDYEALERYMQNNYNDWTHSQKSINRNYKSVGRYRSIMSDMKAGRYKKK